jgi:ABC-2 type transport system permease protein
MQPDAPTLEPIHASGWTSGLTNLLRKELHAWWGTRFWLLQAAIWIVILNGFLIFPLWILPELAAANVQGEDLQLSGIEGFFQIAPLVAAIGITILAQGAIIGEKESGTAAWVLSKPTTRAAFILAKFIAIAIGIGALAIALPATIAYGQIALATGASPALGPYLVGLVLAGLHTLFYLALTLMLGAFSSMRGLVIGIPLALLVMQQPVAALLGPVGWVMPHLLAAVTPLVAQGLPLPSAVPIVSTVLLTALMLGAALWRFEHEEL